MWAAWEDRVCLGSGGAAVASVGAGPDDLSAFEAGFFFCGGDGPAGPEDGYKDSEGMLVCC